MRTLNLIFMLWELIFNIHSVLDLCTFSLSCSEGKARIVLPLFLLTCIHRWFDTDIFLILAFTCLKSIRRFQLILRKRLKVLNVTHNISLTFACNSSLIFYSTTVIVLKIIWTLVKQRQGTARRDFSWWAHVCQASFFKFLDLWWLEYFFMRPGMHEGLKIETFCCSVLNHPLLGFNHTDTSSNTQRY